MASTMQLEFSQAMSDFKTMFPEMDRDVIEAVLRANQGAVDATIDQLLAMSTDNQNERLRNELEKCGEISLSSSSSPRAAVLTENDNNQSSLLDITETKNQIFSITTTTSNATGASPKVKKTVGSCNVVDITTSQQSQQSTSINKNDHKKKWNPPLLGPLPTNFLRLTNILDTNRTDFDLPDEQFALMLQNEEFMNELRWNQEFMNALEKEQQDKGRQTEDDAAFKERLKHMGKISRKKFLQMAKVFTWQRNKKPNTARHLDSLPLKEEPSDDEDMVLKK